MSVHKIIKLIPECVDVFGKVLALLLSNEDGIDNQLVNESHYCLIVYH